MFKKIPSYNYNYITIPKLLELLETFQVSYSGIYLWTFTKPIWLQRFFFICCKKALFCLLLPKWQWGGKVFFLQKVLTMQRENLGKKYFFGDQHAWNQKDLIFGALSLSFYINSVFLFSGQKRASVFVIAVDHDIISYINAFSLTTMRKKAKVVCIFRTI